MQSLTKYSKATIALRDGRSIPQVGLGTWKITDQAVLDEAIDAAMEVGYRHFDCAEMYENEEKIGISLKKACVKHGVARGELWLTSKVPPYKMEPEAAKECVRESAQQLDLLSEKPYLDLALIHWPTTIVAEPGL
jgi:diketogulonate reductase-like aldo/keto reductase